MTAAIGPGYFFEDLHIGMEASLVHIVSGDGLDILRASHRRPQPDPSRRSLCQGNALPAAHRARNAERGLYFRGVRNEASRAGLHLHLANAQLQGAGPHWRSSHRDRPHLRLDRAPQKGDLRLRLLGGRKDRSRRRGGDHGPLAGGKIREAEWTLSRAGRRFPSICRGASLAIGTFDGVHCGHRAVLDAAKAKAAEGGLPMGVMVFEPYPRMFFQPQRPFFRLTSLTRKLELFVGSWLRLHRRDPVRPRTRRAHRAGIRAHHPCRGLRHQACLGWL